MKTPDSGKSSKTVWSGFHQKLCPMSIDKSEKIDEPLDIGAAHCLRQTHRANNNCMDVLHGSKNKFGPDKLALRLKIVKDPHK